MALPAGITTTIVTMGSPVGFDGSTDIRFEGIIQPVAGTNAKGMDPITWAAEVDAIDHALYTSHVLTAGGRYFGDTFTDPATIP